MSDKYTPTTEQIRDLCLLGAIDAADGEHNLDMFETVAMINRWLTAHDAATRTAALEEAAVTKARQIALEERTLLLSPAEVDQVSTLLNADREPSEALVAAVIRAAKVESE